MGKYEGRGKRTEWWFASESFVFSLVLIIRKKNTENGFPVTRAIIHNLVLRYVNLWG